MKLQHRLAALLGHAPLTPSQLAQPLESRGAADALALWNAHHNPRHETATAPSGAGQDAPSSLAQRCEQARCESFAPWPGMRANLSQHLLRRFEGEGANRALTPSSPMGRELLLRAALAEETGQTLPAPAQALVDSWWPQLGRQARQRLAAMVQSRHDQAGFGRLLQSYINQDLAPDSSEPDGEMKNWMEASSPPGAEETTPALSPQQQGEGFIPPEPPDPGPEKDHAPVGKNPEADSAPPAQPPSAAAEKGQTSHANHGGGVQPGSADQKGGAAYHVFTPIHDEEITPRQLCTPAQAAALRAELDRSTEGLRPLVQRLARRLQRQLMALQERQWRFGAHEGTIDPACLPAVVVGERQGRLGTLSFRRESPAPFPATTISLLVDNSGSMRGRSIRMAALTADVLCQTFERCGVSTEVLGFTTKAWKGGESARDWQRQGCPALPGRLNDLRHIIYKSASQPWRHAKHNLGLMLHDDILKENIDGEALEWAAKRLLARPAERRILLVVSDGAPMDESTHAANPGTFLGDHLRSVISRLERDQRLSLLALGIRHDVTRWYSKAVTIRQPEQLAQALVEQLPPLLAPQGSPRQWPGRG
ncbi:cobaltochelatase subunit CobT [Formicincola oecophyllae]|uniref:Cobaltochelatase subunit CobT n=1 Tax=Formicincola oecophyllae TaxID=2558361 RepID=A0A4Y6U924_9PROT|nr:cobaltochelatase subunit CobT [Formicincola oecophyllae]QDH12956.1 cobaltochelatase subunit CobT [Formicincola oecophyllae]